MKKIFLLFAVLLTIVGCKTNETSFKYQGEGNPQLTECSVPSSANFGDSISFGVNVSDIIPLSTLKAELYYGDVLVSSETIRTKENGNYSSKLEVPYLKNIPEASAKLILTATNVGLVTSSEEFSLPLTYCNYPFLTLVGESGDEYRMDKVSGSLYEVTNNFPQKIKAHIVAKSQTASGNDIVFGWEGGSVAPNADGYIPFSNASAGNYTISFDMNSYEANPFVKLYFNNVEMEMENDENYYVVATLQSGSVYELTGIPSFEDWNIDSDFFSRNDAADAQKLTFLPMSGLYKVTANFKHSYLKIEAMSSQTELAVLNADGSGAVWLIGGDSQAKPNIKNASSWNPEAGGLCLARIDDKKYQITFTAGISINAKSFDFKFFHQKSWGGEFNGSKITSTSDLFEANAESGNINLADGKELEMGGVYQITLELTTGSTIDDITAVLSAVKVGDVPVPVAEINFCGKVLTMIDPENFEGVVDLTQDQTLTLTKDGTSILSGAYASVDWIENSKFVPVSGKYKVRVSNITGETSLRFNRLTADGSGEMELQDDGSGAIWAMGWGIGYPSLDSQIGWDPGKAYCMPEVAPKVYQMTGTAGPENGSSIGDLFRFDYMSFKFFGQDGWGFEFTEVLAETAKTLIKNSGNLELADGVNLEQGATYVLTIDCSAGKNSPIINFEKR